MKGLFSPKGASAKDLSFREYSYAGSRRNVGRVAVKVHHRRLSFFFSFFSLPSHHSRGVGLREWKEKREFFFFFLGRPRNTQSWGGLKKRKGEIFVLCPEEKNDRRWPSRMARGGENIYSWYIFRQDLHFSQSIPKIGAFLLLLFSSSEFWSDQPGQSSPPPP